MNPFLTKLTINLSVTLGILLLLVLTTFGISRNIKSNSDAIFELNKDLNLRSASLSEIARLKIAAAGIPPLVDKLKRALPTQDELIVLSSDLGLTARHYDLGYTFRFGSSSPVSAGLESIIFDMTLQGSYQSIISFLGDIETNGRFVSVTNIDVGQQGDKYNATVNGLIYYSDAKKI